ncbi:hypothetical protein GMJLKIPL_3375 [Methylobacterium isbiliense]|uniref:Uncharacterized protein n=1 Tax=Methylobacterium isbiliense TaxID=315478 RepID=A0ABQ4SI89_9HYPH|nr:hypothetical protein GMJLKIPL_3375 [Methylobacterium isbiliense]
MPGLIPGCDHVGAQGRVGRDVLRDPAHEADVPVDAGDREEGVADAAHRAVRGAQDAVLQHQCLATPHPLQRSCRGVAVLRVDAGEPTCEVRHVPGGHAPDLREGGAEIVELPALQVGEPEHVGRMCGEAPEALLALAQGRLGPLLPIDVLHHDDGQRNTAIAFPHRDGADAHPALASLLGAVQEAHVLHDLAPHRPREGVIARTQNPLIRVEAGPLGLHVQIQGGSPAARKEPPTQRIGEQCPPIRPEQASREREMLDQCAEARLLRLDLPQGGSESLLRGDSRGGFVHMTEYALHAAAFVPDR